MHAPQRTPLQGISPWEKRRPFVRDIPFIYIYFYSDQIFSLLCNIQTTVENTHAHTHASTHTRTHTYARSPHARHAMTTDQASRDGLTRASQNGFSPPPFSTSSVGQLPGRSRPSKAPRRLPQPRRFSWGGGNVTGVSCACQVERVTDREETFPSFSIACLLSTPQDGCVIRGLGEGLLRESSLPHFQQCNPLSGSTGLKAL